jgi:hypothetical protein
MLNNQELMNRNIYIYKNGALGIGDWALVIDDW